MYLCFKCILFLVSIRNISPWAIISQKNGTFFFASVFALVVKDPEIVCLQITLQKALFSNQALPSQLIKKCTTAFVVKTIFATFPSNQFARINRLFLKCKADQWRSPTILLLSKNATNLLSFVFFAGFVIVICNIGYLWLFQTHFKWSKWA